MSETETNPAERIYLAGPMTGLVDFNFPAFDAATRKLRELGYFVVSPTECNTDTTLSWAECMKKDLPSFLDCNSIALLPGWQRSLGSCVEMLLAIVFQYSIYYLEDGSLVAPEVDEPVIVYIMWLLTTNVVRRLFGRTP